MTPAQREQLRLLNTAHHRKMQADHGKLRPEQRQRVVEVDHSSRLSLVHAMKSCALRCGMPAVGPVLELGTGSGRDIPFVVEHLAEGDLSLYSGVEIVPEVVARLDGSADVRNLAIEELPEEWNGRFQWIWSRHVMEHVIDLEGAMRALKRVLAPTGVVGAVTPHYFPDPEPAHVTKQTAEEWMAHYRRHGLRPLYCPILPFACPECHLVAIHDDYPLPPGIA